jgi:hypothetical protein
MTFNIKQLLTVIKAAVMQEITEGKKLQETIELLKNRINEQNRIIGNLQTELANTKKDDVKKLMSELGESQTELEEILGLIVEINTTPVIDAAILEVQSNVEVSTPGSLVNFTPDVSTIPDSTHVSSAIEALGVSLVNPGDRELELADVLPETSVIESTEGNIDTSEQPTEELQS